MAMGRGDRQGQQEALWIAHTELAHTGGGHVAQNETKGLSAIGQRTTHHHGYRVSQRKRKRIEEVFSWMNTVGLLRKLRHRGLEQGGWGFPFTGGGYHYVG